MTPLDSVRVPKGFFRWKFEKAGFDTLFAVSFTQDSLWRRLDTLGRTPRGMVRVSGGRSYEIEDTVVTLGEFFMDKYEVTNAQYKKFVEAGGYQNPQVLEA